MSVKTIVETGRGENRGWKEKRGDGEAKKGTKRHEKTMSLGACIIITYYLTIRKIYKHHRNGVG